MEFLKKLFDGKALTYEELETAVNGAGIKLADVSSGYARQGDLEAKERELKAANESIRELTGQSSWIRSLPLTSRRSGVLHGQTRPRIQACLTRSEIFLLLQQMPRQRGIRKGASALM